MIPYNLKLNHLVVELNSSDFEINANRADVGLRVFIVRESKQQTGLADP